jgi:hypothetical protein
VAFEDRLSTLNQRENDGLSRFGRTGEDQGDAALAGV